MSARIRIYKCKHLQLPEPQSPTAELVVLAGDIHEGVKAAQWARENFTVPVIMVAGNHEFYGSKNHYPRVIEKAQVLTAGTPIHYLQNSLVNIGGVNFLGGVLWTDFQLNGNGVLDKLAASNIMRDYQVIRTRPDFKRLTPNFVELEHHKTKQFLIQTLEALRGQTNVVITHHAPCIQSIPEYRRGSQISACYASHLDELMNEFDIAVWFHGHTHTSSDYIHPSGTRVVCNPRGYAQYALNPGFQKQKIIEIEP